MSKNRGFFSIIFYFAASLDSQDQEDLAMKRPNILEILLQTIAGEPTRGYNSPLSETACALC
jgi:hypothetical protein